ncbi:catalase-like domain-containing protein [Lophiotrema nucula]|uniref:Catalase-like domain-containing protein n=1 Tax=Lophiotrema nucula TaxID=690887 RepID=A0A6A5YR68_9PLEO|nr:catalase-like domain-containing protein [Lophiotrema nucula]
MPLSDNTEIVDTAKGLVSTLQVAAGGKHAGFRPAHAHGHLLTGTFTPTPSASTLSKAYHFNNPVPITVRFSSSTGFPDIPDTDPQSNPRGIAIRFHLPDKDGRRQHTDIIAHSTAFFPTRTGAEFLEFLKRATTGGDVPGFLAEHPETVAFLQDPKPSPVSFATEKFFGVNAFKYIAADGTVTYIRNRVVPVAGVQVLSEEELASQSKTYLFDELSERLGSGSPIEFKLQAQIADEGDVTDDATVHWPEERKIVELGTVKVEKSLGEGESLKQQKRDIFDPIPRVEGVDVSGDPLLEDRANVYLVSGRERRAA